jgi:hypothetical protein
MNQTTTIHAEVEGTGSAGVHALWRRIQSTVNAEHSSKMRHPHHNEQCTLSTHPSLPSPTSLFFHTHIWVKVRGALISNRTQSFLEHITASKSVKNRTTRWRSERAKLARSIVISGIIFSMVLMLAYRFARSIFEQSL